jgi:large subunit ribosomal protein L9
MEILLVENVINLGSRGDVVTVKDGYARNFLLPKKLALPVTMGNKRQIELEKERVQKLRAAEHAEALELKAKLDELILKAIKKVGDNGHLFGSVTNAEVADLLRQKGFVVDKQAVSLPHIKDLGAYTVHVKLYSGVASDVKLEVVSEAAKAE